MPHYFRPTEEDLLPIKGKDLKEGYCFWIKQDDGQFHKAVVQLGWYHTPDLLYNYRAGITKLSGQGKLFTRRDKPGEDFRDLL